MSSTIEHYVLADAGICLVCGDDAEWLESRSSVIHYASNESMLFNLFTPGKRGQQPEFHDCIWEHSIKAARDYGISKFGPDCYVQYWRLDTVRCPETGYKWGAAWLAKRVPEDVLENLRVVQRLARL